MPQWRKLHVKATESLDINDMPDDFTRLLWVMMPLGLDREGRGMDHPAWVKAKIMPLRFDITEEMISSAMDWYEERGMIVRYRIKGRSYFYATNFSTYQGNTSKEAESNFPPPPDPQESKPKVVKSNSRPTPELVQSKSSTDADADAEENNGADAPPRQEQNRIRFELQKHFQMRTGLPAPKINTQKQKRSAGALWFVPLREIAELAEWDEDTGKEIINASLEKLSGVTVTDPNSVIKTARAVYAEMKGGGTQRRQFSEVY